MKKLLSVLMAIVIVISLSSSFAATKVSGKQLGSTGTALDDFEFKIEGDIIKLEEYKGKESSLFIEPSYEIDGKTYTTDLSGFMVGIGNMDVKEVFIPEGIEEIPARIFNSCGVEKFYIPHSIKHFPAYALSYFHKMFVPNGVKVFYAGTQAEFEAMLLEGSEATNPYIGNGFEAELFDFIFEATPEDYTSGEF